MELELEAESKYREDIELPLLALHATWIAAQSRGKRMKSVSQLLRGSKPQMSRMEMVSNLELVHKKALKNLEKKNANRDAGRSSLG